MELTELNDLLRDNLLLAIAATADNPDLVLPDNWLELVEAWEEDVRGTHWRAGWWARH
jgi:hypothetical protein